MQNKKTSRNRTKARKERQRQAPATKQKHKPRVISIAHGRSGLAILAALAGKGRL